MHSIENRFVVRPSNILFAGVYVSAFQPGGFTGLGQVLQVNAEGCG